MFQTSAICVFSQPSRLRKHVRGYAAQCFGLIQQNFILPAFNAATDTLAQCARVKSLRR